MLNVNVVSEAHACVYTHMHVHTRTNTHMHAYAHGTRDGRYGQAEEVKLLDSCNRTGKRGKGLGNGDPETSARNPLT